MEERFETIDEAYETGYQEGQMDVEKELLDELTVGTHIEMTREMRLGHDTVKITITTFADARIYGLLLNHARNKAAIASESVVSQGPNVPNSHISGTFPTLSEAKKGYGKGNMAKKPVKKATA